MTEESGTGDHRQSVLSIVARLMDDLDVPEDHRVRGLAEEIYCKTTHRAGPKSFAAGLCYLSTQADDTFSSVTQEDVSEVSGVSIATVRHHYQEIARGVLDE